jgi:hypothetical protein
MVLMEMIYDDMKGREEWRSTHREHDFGMKLKQESASEAQEYVMAEEP